MCAFNPMLRELDRGRGKRKKLLNGMSKEAVNVIFLTTPERNKWISSVGSVEAT